MINLAALGLVLEDSLTRLNVLKQFIALVVNVAAAILFLFSGRVVWVVALVLGVGALVGGILGGRLAGRVAAGCAAPHRSNHRGGGGFALSGALRKKINFLFNREGGENCP